MKIENLKVYDLADSIMASSFPMSIDLEDSEKNKYVFPLDENNECFIPAEILSNEGEFLIGVFGTNTDGSRLVTNMIPFKRI